MAILVTGGAGIISEVTQTVELLNAGYEVVL